MEPKQKPGRSRQDYGTPPEFLEAVKQRLGIHDFDCDLAASDENTVTHMGYCTAKDDALSLRTWKFRDGWNWLNPPFNRIAPWVEKSRREWVRHGAQTAVLIPASVGSNWWRDHVDEYASVLFLNPRLTFLGCDDPFPKDCALLLYGEMPTRYKVWTWKPSTKADAVARPDGVATASPVRDKTSSSVTNVEVDQ